MTICSQQSKRFSPGSSLATDSSQSFSVTLLRWFVIITPLLLFPLFLVFLFLFMQQADKEKHLRARGMGRFPLGQRDTEIMAVIPSSCPRLLQEAREAMLTVGNDPVLWSGSFPVSRAVILPDSPLGRVIRAAEQMLDSH